MGKTIEKNGRFWRFSRNRIGRDFVVGDIHGELAALYEAMGAVSFDTDRDRLFSVGDLVDRGPQSFETLKLAREDWFFPVMGNHDQVTALLANQAGRALVSALLPAMQSDKDSVNWPNALLDDDALNTAYTMDAGWLVDRIDNLRRSPNLSQELSVLTSPGSWPLAIEVDTAHGPVGIVHAQPPADDWARVEALLSENRLRATDPVVQTTVWGRSIIKRVARGETVSPVAGVTRIYAGHTVVGPKPMTAGNRTWIDVGAVFGKGELVLHRLSERCDRKAA